MVAIDGLGLKRTVAEEREFEHVHILKLAEMYLSSDVLEKVRTDAGYRVEVEQIERQSVGIGDWVLDIGWNTCGECEYLVSRVYRLIATDVYEFGLAISCERSGRFGRIPPAYVACDGRQLPLPDASMGEVVFNESLHHMPSPKAAVREAAEVLKPAGIAVLFKPRTLDPWRRISETRDYLRSSIEKGFATRQVRRLLSEAGLAVVSVERVVYPRPPGNCSASRFTPNGGGWPITACGGRCRGFSGCSL